MSSPFEILFLGFLNIIQVPYFPLSSLSSIKRNCSTAYFRKNTFPGSLFYFTIFIKNALYLMPLKMVKYTFKNLAV